MTRFAMASVLLTFSMTAAQAGSMPGTALVVVDGNGDDIVTMQEYVSGVGKLFAPLDANSNGRIEWSEAEVTMSRELFDGSDTDGNGVLSRSEFDAELRKEFNFADKDGDGVLD